MIPHTPSWAVAQLLRRIRFFFPPTLLAIGFATQLTLAAPPAAAQDSFTTAGTGPILQGATNGTIGPISAYYLDFDTVENDSQYAQSRLEKLGWTGRSFEVREPNAEERSGGFDDFMEARQPAYSDWRAACEDDAFSDKKPAKHVWSWEDDWQQIKMVRLVSDATGDRLEELDYWGFQNWGFQYRKGDKHRKKHTNSWNWRTVSPHVKTIKIVFYSAPTTADVERALEELQITGATPVAMPPTFCTSDGQPSLEDVLKDIERVDTLAHPLKLVGRVQFAGITNQLQSAGRLPQIKVYQKSRRHEAHKWLYKLAQSLTDDPVKQGIYKGAEACAGGDRDKAWFYFEGVNDLAKDNPEIAEQILHVYKTVKPAPPEPAVNPQPLFGPSAAEHSCDLEICVWLTRFIQSTLDWDKFENALKERSTIEAFYSMHDEQRNQQLSNLRWVSERMPLKVYFHDTGSKDYNQELMTNFRKCVEYWSIASGTKLDYVVVGTKDHYDISVKWTGDHNWFYNIDFRNRTHVPNLKPFTARLGQTWVHQSSADNRLIDHAQIEICDDYSIIDECLLAVLLHETGHAFGIRRHLNDSSNVMYYAVAGSNENQKTELTAADASTMKSLYQEQPICHSAVERFIGLPALCDRVTFTQPTLQIAGGTAPLPKKN